MTSKKRIMILGSVVIAIGLGFLFLNLWARIDLGNLPPENATSTTMSVLKTRILRYAKTNNRLPTKLSDLPALEGYVNSVTDAWGNEIQLQIDGTTVTLISYGKDQQPRGVGDNLDVIGVFETKSQSGFGWLDENTDWKVKPLTKINLKNRL